MRTGRFLSSEGLRVPAGAPPRSLLSDLRQTPQNQDPETEGPRGHGLALRVIPQWAPAQLVFSRMEGAAPPATSSRAAKAGGQEGT